MSELDRPIRVWKYRGWCAICTVCKISLAVDAGSQQLAFAAAELHAREHLASAWRPVGAG